MQTSTPKRLPLSLRLGLLPLLGVLLLRAALAAEGTPAHVAVYFSPHGGATDPVGRGIKAAQHQILVQAHSFTAGPVAQAVLRAPKRGGQVPARVCTSHEN